MESYFKKGNNYNHGIMVLFTPLNFCGEYFRHGFFISTTEPLKYILMDNKKSTDGRDRSKIDINDQSEVEYVHQQFPKLSHDQVVSAIKEKGPSREAVMNYLKTKGSKN